MKYYYPAEYMAALITCFLDNPEKSAEYINVARNMGIEVLPPDINEGKTYFNVKDGKLIYSLAAIKNVGESVIKKIEPVCLPKKHFEPTVFPYLKDDGWNESNFGPLIVPKEDKIIKFSNIQVAKYYRRVIETYEGNKTEIKGNKVFINGKMYLKFMQF